MEVPECPATPPILTEGLSSPKHSNESPVASVQSGAGSPRSGSPEPNCPICLGPLDNKSYSDSCFHKFCFKCLLEWSKVKAECPLCKQKFKSIIHNVKSMDEYDQYTVQPTAAVERERLLMMMDQINTLNMPRWWLRGREVRRHHQNLPAQVPQPNRGNLLHLFDMLPPSPNSFYDAREQRILNRGSLNPSGLEQRRIIYRSNLWAQPLPDVTGRTREFSLEFYRRNPATTHRLLPWITRDLSAICERSLIAVALERINTLLMRHDMRSSAFSRAIREYLGEHTRHFMHELISFARSPYDMMGYDRHVTHSSWYPRLDEYILANDEDDSDSEDDIIELPLSPSTNASLAISIPPIDLSNIRVGRDIYRPPTRSPSPEPGPSGLSAFSATSPFLIESSDDDDLISFPAVRCSPIDNGSMSDVEVVAVLKPKHERTPELIDLLSDSETIVNSPSSPNTTQPPSPQSSQPSSSRWDEPSTSHIFFDPGPSTSTYDPNITDNASSGFKSETNVCTAEVEIPNDSLLPPFSDSSDSSQKIHLPSKHKHKKHKKYKYRLDSSDDEPLERHRSKHKKRKSSSDNEKKSKKRKRRTSPLRLSEIAVCHTKNKSNEGERKVASPKKSKYSWSWRVHELADTSDDDIDQPPRIRSIVVKRQPPPTDGGDASTASSSSVSHSQPTISDSDDSWQPYYKHHKKSSSKNKSKGSSSKGKGKKK